MALEDEFNVEIPDKDAEEIFTPRQAVEKVCDSDDRFMQTRMQSKSSQFGNKN
jgi:hypothetical protein